MTALIRSGGDAGIRALLSCMRSQDAAMRTAAIDALRAAPKAVHPFMQLVLQDDDADIRILATELVRNMAPAEATNILVGLLEKEQHPNVCAAAVEVIAEVGTAAAVPALRDCAARFADTPFLPFAISTAIARISEAESR
jgi:HEAT repeat protein